MSSFAPSSASNGHGRRGVLGNAVRFGANYLAGSYGGTYVRPDAPAALLIGVTNKCNLRCDFCFHAGNDVPAGASRTKGLMSFERFAAIVAQASGWCTHLEFGLFGEPMLHPRFVDMVRLAVDAGLTVAIYTNGTLLNATRAAALVQEHVDAVLFANYRVSTIKTDVGFKKQVVRGVSGGDRLLHTIERPAFLAKNRFDLPESLTLDWAKLAAGIPFYARQTEAAAEGAE